jgi:hypothetical protein
MWSSTCERVINIVEDSICWDKGRKKLLCSHKHGKGSFKIYIYYFHTGVLNTEELAIINTTFSQTGKSSLAGIPEEVGRSSESTTTLDTDNWTLESLESELFDNIRASIQKTLGLSEKEPSSTSGSLQKNRKEGSDPSRLGCKSHWQMTC